MAIHYTKTNWLNNEQPAINQANLNKIEQGIYDATEALNDRVQTVNNQSPDADGNVELQTLPSGGTAGQTIIKQSSTEGDAIWADLNATGIELTQVEYDALSEAEKNNGSLYFITDGVSSPSANTIPASGVSYGSGSVADALDSLNGRIPSVEKIIGIATNATTTQIHIQYPSTAGIVLFYFDIGRRVAILNKTSGNSMQYEALNGTFNNTSFSSTDAYLTVGNWCRATLIITSTSLSEITVETV